MLNHISFGNLALISNSLASFLASIRIPKNPLSECSLYIELWMFLLMHSLFSSHFNVLKQVTCNVEFIRHIKPKYQTALRYYSCRFCEPANLISFQMLVPAVPSMSESLASENKKNSAVFWNKVPNYAEHISLAFPSHFAYEFWKQAAHMSVPDMPVLRED